MTETPLILLGFGNVGRSFAKLVEQCKKKVFGRIRA